MIARIIRHTELDMARDLVKHPRIARYIRRASQVLFAGGMLWVVCMIPYAQLTYRGIPGVPVPWPEPQVIARMLLTDLGVLTPVAFFVLLHMRFSRWRWPATGLVGLFAYTWFTLEVTAIWLGLGTLKVWMSKGGPYILGMAASAAGLLLLFGFLERVFDLAENERARQQAQREQ